MRRKRYKSVEYNSVELRVHKSIVDCGIRDVENGGKHDRRKVGGKRLGILTTSLI